MTVASDLHFWNGLEIVSGAEAYSKVYDRWFQRGILGLLKLYHPKFRGIVAEPQHIVQHSYMGISTILDARFGSFIL